MVMNYVIHTSVRRPKRLPFGIHAGMLLALLQTGTAAGQNGSWSVIDDGLELGHFQARRECVAGDSTITVLRIDPARYSFLLLNASAPGNGSSLTAREWCTRSGAVAAINASMYQGDFKTSVALMQTATHVNNKKLTSDNAVMAFDRRDTTVPPVQIVDRTCQDFASLKQHYRTLVQNIRMVSCHQTNVWSQQPKRWSAAAIGTDTKGRVLFIHCRSAYSVHDLTGILLGLPIGLYNAMYVEGGPEAQIYVNTGGHEIELVGSYETGFFEDDSNSHAWPVPNVIAVVRRGNEQRH